MSEIRCQFNFQTGFARRLHSLWGLALLLSLLGSACTSPKAAPASAALDPATLFPSADLLPGWEISQKAATYDHANLFNLVDGKAESFFAYGFEQVAVQRYQDRVGILLNVDIWRLATPADAYGLFSAGRSGGPAAIGNEADVDPGRRLAFWQDRYFVNLNAAQPLADATLPAFAQAIAEKLPTGGERPALLDRLPPTGLVERSAIFFHEEMSVQMEVWLGGENLLGLSQATDGVLGRYQLGAATLRLLLVEYPAPGQAVKGLKALKSGGLTDLLASNLQGNRLGAVFGKVDLAQARTLLQEALK